MRKVIVALLLILALPALMGSLPSGIENAIRGWFNSSGKLASLRFWEDNSPPVPTANTCDLYMDAATDSLVASCDGGALRVLVGAASTACNEDGNGNLVCNTITSLDQNSLVTPAGNRFRIFDNDVDLTPNPSCTDYGQAGILTLLDKDESSVDNYVWCDGTSELHSLTYDGVATRIAVPFGWGHGGSNTAALTDDQCACRLFTLNQAILDLDTIAVTITTPDSDANEATTLGVFSFDGLTQYFTGTLTDTGSGTVNTTNSTTAPAIMLPGNYWFCTGYNQTVNTELRLRAANGDASRVASFTQSCAGGTMPSTLTNAAITFGTAILPHVVLTDD